MNSVVDEIEPISEIGPILVTDTTGQRRFTVDSMPSEATIDEIVKNLLSPMGQPSHDPEGRPNSYGVYSERESRFLGGNERIGDAVMPDDTLMLMRSVDAG